LCFIPLSLHKLPAKQQGRARRLGLGLALFLRLGLLFAITWVMGLTDPLVSAIGREFSGRHLISLGGPPLPASGRELSGRDLILLGGGLFLIAKATREIHENLEVEHPRRQAPGGR